MRLSFYSFLKKQSSAQVPKVQYQSNGLPINLKCIYVYMKVSNVYTNIKSTYREDNQEFLKEVFIPRVTERFLFPSYSSLTLFVCSCRSEYTWPNSPQEHS